MSDTPTTPGAYYLSCGFVAIVTDHQEGLTAHWPRNGLQDDMSHPGIEWIDPAVCVDWATDDAGNVIPAPTLTEWNAFRRCADRWNTDAIVEAERWREIADSLAEALSSLVYVTGDKTLAENERDWRKAYEKLRDYEQAMRQHDGVSS